MAADAAAVATTVITAVFIAAAWCAGRWVWLAAAAADLVFVSAAVTVCFAGGVAVAWPGIVPLVAAVDCSALSRFGT